MQKNIFFISLAFYLVILTSCKHDVTVIAMPRTDLHLDSNSLVGTHLVDKDGISLYFFSDDANGQSSCTGGCLLTWPIFKLDSSITTFTGGLLPSDFKTITTPSGASQTTYKGWPLYYYTPGGVAETAGQTTGEGIGNVWFVAKTNYSVMIANNQLTGANGINYLGNYTAGDGRTNYFTDGNGNTLYSFAKDSALLNKFTKPDFSNNASFPIYETGNITVPSTLDKSLFVVVPFNGKNQLTYNGWPLYYYGGDGFVMGSNKGVSIPPSLPAGSIWPVAVKTALPAPKN